MKEYEVTPPRPRTRFLRGPIPWIAICMASKIPGQALAAFLAIHHRAAITGGDTVTLSRPLLSDLGVSRDAKARALHALQEAGLVAVERSSGRSARIRLLTSAKHGG